MGRPRDAHRLEKKPAEERSLNRSDSTPQRWTVPGLASEARHRIAGWLQQKAPRWRRLGFPGPPARSCRRALPIVRALEPSGRQSSRSPQLRGSVLF